jgi:hypothetical protein
MARHFYMQAEQQNKAQSIQEIPQIRVLIPGTVFIKAGQ